MHAPIRLIVELTRPGWKVVLTGVGVAALTTFTTKAAEKFGEKVGEKTAERLYNRKKDKDGEQ